MTKNQFQDLVDRLANVCLFNTSKRYSLSLDETQWEGFYDASLSVFTMNPCGLFTTSDVALLLALATAFDVSLYFETINGVTVAKYL